ncbi:MAG: endolytic transglycosylase MltG [Deltaproteobacteria bacterium]|nr:endolytic transglycosylase MltG [Deltaproteobacteria bacterium]
MNFFICSEENKIRIVIGVVLVFLCCFAIFLSYATTPIDKNLKSTVIEIPQGASFDQTIKILDQVGLIKNKQFFYLLAVLKNATKRIKVGEYEFAGTMTPANIIDRLLKGEIKQYWVKIPEDKTLQDIALLLSSPENNFVDQETFLELTSDRIFLDSLGIDAPTAEGYLYPDTYRLNHTMTPQQIIRAMVNQFRKKVTPEMFTKAEKLGLNEIEFITMASLIGKETGYRQEKNLISAVFHNRLKKGMRLQSDPTAIYDLENFSGRIRRKHLKRKSPYNTYVINGLPPGPIANPGISSFKAAINPAPVDYLYFVSKNNGTHHFSSTLSEHNTAALKY